MKRKRSEKEGGERRKGRVRVKVKREKGNCAKREEANCKA